MSDNKSDDNFYQLLYNVGNASYNLNRNFTNYAGFLEGLMGGMFYDLSEEKKAYYVKRAREKLAELALEHSNRLAEQVGEPL